MVEEFSHRVFLWIVAQADKIDLVLRNLLEAPDHPRLLVAIVVGQKAFFIGLTMVLVFESMEETVHILSDGEDRGRLPVGGNVEAVQLRGSLSLSAPMQSMGLAKTNQQQLWPS